MGDKKLMRLMVDCPGVIRRIYLSESQLELFRLVRSADESLGVTTNWISDYMDISIQSANGRLVELMNKGYLTRVNQGDPTGGKEYVYRSVALHKQ